MSRHNLSQDPSVRLHGAHEEIEARSCFGQWLHLDGNIDEGKKLRIPVNLIADSGAI